jgi:S-formylglutathione hydrolase FrmB
VSTQRVSGALASAVLCAAIVGVAGAGGERGPEIPRGYVRRESFAVPELGDSSRAVRVYLPPSYDAPGIGRNYPVVFLLHGWPGSSGNWFEQGRVPATADSLIASGQIPEVIIVSPDGNGTGLLGRSLWIDSYDGRRKFETWLAGGLVRWVDEHFRTRREAAARAVVGLSDGALGAFNVVLKHPDVFSAAGGHSGDYLPKKGFGTGAIFGPDPRAQEIEAENTPAAFLARVAETAKQQRLYLDSGLDDGDAIGGTRALHEKLTELGVPHEYHEFPGSHSWGYWRTHVRESLIAVTAGMR